MIRIVSHNSAWPTQFQMLGAELVSVLDNLAIGIYHIGSTAVPGLAAKDIIDIQVSVHSLTDEIISRLATIGFLHRGDITRDHQPPGINELPAAELYKWYFKRADTAVHLHVRVRGRFNERYALLCRDYLRANAATAKAYEVVKTNLAKRFAQDQEAYYDIKDPVFDIIMAGAELWATVTAWELPASDA